MKLRLLISAIAVSMSALAAQAATFSIVYEGTLTSDFGTGAFDVTGWSAGTAFRTVGVFDTATTPFSTFSTPTLGSSASYLTTQTTLQIGSDFVSMGAFGLTVGDNTTNGSVGAVPIDNLLLQKSPAAATLGGITWDAVLNYAIYNGSALSGTALPDAAPTEPFITTGSFPSVFQLSFLEFDASRSSIVDEKLINGAFTSVSVVAGDVSAMQPVAAVPLPASALLLLGGLGGLAALRRRTA